MYSEHLVAAVLRFTVDHFDSGSALDAVSGRHVVQIAGIIGTDLGCAPQDQDVAWWAAKVGTTVGAQSRAAIHVLPGNRLGVGLGAGRGVVESTGDRLAVVHRPEEGRYTGVYRVPGVEYGGLL